MTFFLIKKSFNKLQLESEIVNQVFLYKMLLISTKQAFDFILSRQFSLYDILVTFVNSFTRLQKFLEKSLPFGLL